jgi:DNA polymerase-3 subunit beta
MKILCTQENIRTGLSQVSRIITPSSTLPILNNVLLKTENGGLVLMGTNLEVGVKTFVRCKVEAEGAVCVNVKTLAELISTMPAAPVTLSLENGELVVATDHYSTKLKALPADDYPTLPEVTAGQVVTVESVVMKRLFDEVAFAASTSTTQPEISGLYLEVKDREIVAAATDRYRLAEAKIDQIKHEQDATVIIPPKAVIELSRLLQGATGQVAMYLTENQIGLVVGETSLVSRLIDGQYPDYRQIIPSTSATQIIVNRADLTSALRTSGIFSKGMGSVTLNFDAEKEQITIAAASQDIGDAVITVPCQINGDSGQVILNYRYILDVLQVLTETVLHIEISGDSAPVVIRPSDRVNYLYLVMPIKI